MKTTVENNRMIAGFMGVEYTYDKKEGAYYDAKTGELIGIEFKYHTSWDWLMPVVEKIETELEDDYWIKVTKIQDTSDYISYVYYAGHNEGKPFRIDWLEYPKSRIEATYIAVVQFIEWYNEQN